MADDAKLLAVIDANTVAFQNALKRLERTTDQSFRQQARSVKRLDAELTKTGLTASALGAKLSGITRSFGAGLVGGLGVGAVLSLGGAIDKARSALASFDAIAKSARTTGLTPEFLQSLSFAAVEAGVSQETLNSSLLIFAKNSGLAADGTGALAAGLKKTNPELLKAIQLAQTQDERLRLVAEAMRQASSAAERAALSSIAFGRGGVELTEIFSGGAAALDDFMRRAKQMGIIIDRSLLENADRLDDQLSLLAKVIDINVNVALVRLAPLLVSVSTAVASFSKEIRDATASAEAFFATAIFRKGSAEPSGSFGDVHNFIVGLIDDLKRGTTAVEKVQTELTRTFQTISQSPEALKFVEPGQLELLKKLQGLLGKNGEGAEDVKDELKKLADSNPRFQSLVDRLNPLLDIIIKIRDAAVKAGTAVGTIGAAVPSFREAERTSGEALAREQERTAAFITQRAADAAATEFQRDLDQRTDQILEEADKLGLVLSKAAARIQAGAELASEHLTERAAASVSDAAALIQRRENFISTPKFDVNHLRIGFGSDTMTDVHGTVSEVVASSVTTIADATRDLNRRIGDVQLRIAQEVGAETFAKLSSGALAALTSLVYNYGKESKRLTGVFAAAQQSPFALAASIENLQGDNGGINRGRRLEEAQMVLTGVPGGEAGVAAMQAQTEAMQDQAEKAKALEDAKKTLIATTEREIEALGLEVKAFGQTTFEAEKAKQVFDLTNQAIDANLTLTPEMTAQIDAWATSLANLAVQSAEAEKETVKLADSEQDAIARMDEIRSTASDVLGGFIKDLIAGKSAAEALANAVGKIADKLLDVALDNLMMAIFPNPKAGGSTGGLLGGAIIPGILHGGGIAGRDGYGTGRAVSPLVFAGAQRYHSGGLAGLRNGEVPAILQRGELVVPSMNQMRGIGGRGGGQQREMRVRNDVFVNPSALFETVVKSHVEGAISANNRRLPDYLSDRRARGT